MTSCCLNTRESYSLGENTASFRVWLGALSLIRLLPLLPLSASVAHAMASSAELPCILQHGCVCNHTQPYLNPIDSQTYGTCTACEVGFTGPTCNRPRVDCQNLGYLRSNGTCECSPAWTGDACTDKQCINSKGGVGPYSIAPPVKNFCNACKNGCGGLSCDMCTSNEGCANSDGGPKCGRLIAVPQTEQYNMICTVDEAFVKPLGPKRNVAAKVGYECRSPSNFKDAKDAECAVSFYRIEENKEWIDPFFFCTGYECGMVETTSVRTLPEDQSSAKNKFFSFVKSAGQVALLGICFVIAIARYVPGPRNAQNMAVRVSSASLFIVLGVYIFISLVVMSSPTVETVRLVTYTCDRTACVCGENPPNPAYSPFCSDSPFGQYILPTITHKTTLQCNAMTGECFFEPEDVPTRIGLQCEASECIPSNASQVDVKKKDSDGAEQRGGAWVMLMLSALVAISIGVLHYFTSLRYTKRAQTEFAQRYLSIVNPEEDRKERSGVRNPSPGHGTRNSASNLSIDMNTVPGGAAEFEDEGDDVDPLSEAPLEDEDFMDSTEATHLNDGGGVGGGLAVSTSSTAANTSHPRSTMASILQGEHNTEIIDTTADTPSSTPSSSSSFTVRADGLCYSVSQADWPWQDSQHRRVKHILRDVSFTAKSGDVVALMGSSGAGKTTLLDILAARQKSGTIGGYLRLDGVNVLNDAFRYRALVGYVAQEDTLLPNLTVRQTLLYAARLKLPTAFSSRTIRSIVDELMLAMGISRCAHTIIGDGANSRGLSGGEKRRVSIAVEMVANPRILFLDEPTSGLDASNALRVMEAVSLLAKTSPLAKYAPHYFSFKPIIIASIHQPSKAIFAKFTHLVLMSRGLCIYAGPCGDNAPLQRLSDNLGDVERVPPTCDNPAEGLLLIDDIVTDEEREALADKAAAMNASPNAARGVREGEVGIADGEEGTEESAGEIVSEEVRGLKNGTALLAQVQELKRFYASSYAQLFLLVRRSYASLMGSYYLVAAHALVTVFMGSLMCTLYSAEPLSLPGALNRAGSITFLLLVQSFISLSALEQLMTERKLFVTERENGFYTTGPYLLSKLLVDVVPLRMIPAIVVGSIIYFPMGLRTDEGSYFLWFLVILTLFTVCISLLVMCVGVLTSSFGSAALISSVIILWNFVFGGLLVQADTIPSSLQPFRKLSPFYVTFEALLVNELDGQMCTFAPTDAAGRPSDTVIPLYCVQYLYNLGLHPDRFQTDIMVLGLECILFVLVAYLLLARAQLTR